MNKEQLQNLYKNADRVVRFLDKNGKFRASIINNTQTALTAQKNHNLPFIPAVFLAKLLAASGLLSSFLKGEERVQLDISTNGIISFIFAESLQVGESRGYINYNSNQLDTQVNSVNDYLGAGFLKVSKILYDKREPITGIVELVRGDISTDIAYYFLQSEQIPSALILDVKLSDDGLIEKSAGLIIQALPGATEEEIKNVNSSLKNAKELNNLIYSYSYEEIGKIIFPFEFDIIASTRVDFFCRCSKDNFISKLITLSLSEVTEMKDRNENELVCTYCNKHYYLTDKDFEQIIETVKSKYN